MSKMGVFIFLTLCFHVILAGVLGSEPLNQHPDSEDAEAVNQPKPKSVTKWAVLVAGSWGWKNYRHRANVCHAYQLLKNGGFNDSHIIIFMVDDIARHKLNPQKGYIFNNRKGINVYKKVPKDYTGKQVTAENFYNVILGNRSALTGGSRKVLDSGPSDHIFIYYSDHGKPGRLGMPGKYDFVYSGDFLKVLQAKYRAKSYSRMVIYIEACYSGSMFDSILPEDLNIYATTAANTTGLSYGCYESKKFGTPLGDRYSVSWIEDSEVSDLKSRTLDDQFNWVKERTASFRWPTSEVMKYGSLELGTIPVGEFLESSSKYKKSALDANIDFNDYTSLPEGSAQTFAAAKKEFEDEIYERKRATKNMKKIIDVIFKSASDKRRVVQTHRPAGKPVVDNWECLKRMEKSFITYCGEPPACKWKYTYVISNLCNAGFSAKRFGRVASRVCSRHRRN